MQYYQKKLVLYNEYLLITFKPKFNYNVKIKINSKLNNKIR